jgi:hypothetical protein
MGHQRGGGGGGGGGGSSSSSSSSSTIYKCPFSDIHAPMLLKTYW